MPASLPVLWTWLVFATIARAQQPGDQSPCPSVFSYETTPERGRWYGSLQLYTDVTLHGVWIDIVLDREADSLGNWFGDVVFSDKTNFKIENTRQILHSESTTPVRFYVKYNTALRTPRLKNIRLNGREICTPSSATQTESQNSNRRNSEQENLYNKKQDQPTYLENDDQYTSNNKRNQSHNTYFPSVSQNPSKEVINRESSHSGINDDNIFNTGSQNNRRNQNSHSVSTGPSYERSTTTRRPQLNTNEYNQQPGRRATPTKLDYQPPEDTDIYSRPVRPQTSVQSTGSQTTSSFNGQNNERINPNVNQFTRQQTTTRRTPKPKVTSDNSGDSEDEDYKDTIDHRPDKGNNRDAANDYYEGDHRIPQEEKIIPTPLPFDQPSSQECGKVAVQAAPLILNGQATVQGQWPWHVAIFQSQTVEASKYICGGSLVTASHVITAAHCVIRKTASRVVNMQTLTVYLGKFNLRKSTDGVQIMLVRRIFVHPDYNATNFYADVALLKLTRPSEYTNYVRPVCLWKESETDFSHIIDREGSVVGWGFDEDNRVTEELALVKMPVVKHSTCLWSFKEFFTHFTSNHSYCAGFANGTSVCNGDSGGGMVFPDISGFGSSPTWRLRGLVSISVARQNENICDPYHYVVFTDLAMFLDWIKSKLLV